LLSRFVSNAGQEVHIPALKSDALHHLSDAITSLAAFIGISGLHPLIDIHVEVDGNMSVSRGHEIAHRVKDALLESKHCVVDVLVHIEPH